MKLMIASLLLVSASAFAYNTDREIHYVSWCSDNQVVVNSANNENVVIADCSTQNLVCKEQVRPQGRVMIASASCKER